MTLHHQRLNGWTACGRSPDEVRHNDGTGDGVTCRSCLRSLERRPAASAPVRDFAAGMSMEAVAEKHGITVRQVLDEIREVLS